MATIYWLGGATAVAQVDTASIDTLDATPANTTYTITVGDASVSTPGNSTVAQTATDLVALANGNTVGAHMSVITFAVPSGANITATADVAGVEFVATLSATGGNGTVTNFAATTASAGPADVSTLANYSTGALPTSSDTLILRDTTGNLAYNLDAIGNAAAVVIEQTYTGRIGLATTEFARDSTGGNTTTVREYREDYLTGNFAAVTIGAHTGTGSPTGSTRVKIASTATAAGSNVHVVNSASSSAEANLPAVRLLGSSANLDVFIDAAPGGVGIASDRPDETATVGDVYVTGSQAVAIIGAGTTLTTYTQAAGTGAIAGSASTVTTVKTTGGSLDISGDFTITALNVEGGTVTDSHIKTSGNAVTTATVIDGTLDLQASDAARTINSLVHQGGKVLDNPAVTFTSHTRARATITA